MAKIKIFTLIRWGITTSVGRQLLLKLAKGHLACSGLVWIDLLLGAVLHFVSPLRTILAVATYFMLASVFTYLWLDNFLGAFLQSHK